MFVVFNLIMLCLGAVAIFSAWKYLTKRNEADAGVAAFAAIACGSVFSFYVVALGLGAAIEGLWLFVKAVIALFH